MAPFNQSFPKISVANFFDAVGYCGREWGDAPRIQEYPMEEPMKEPELKEGATVLQEVVRMTGLSEDYLDSALTGLLGKPDTSVNEMTLGELRSLLLDCLESLNEEMESGQVMLGNTGSNVP
jgi:hypothetical protein